MPAYMLLLASFSSPSLISVLQFAFSTIQMIREVYIHVKLERYVEQTSSVVLVHDGNIYVTYM